MEEKKRTNQDISISIIIPIYNIKLYLEKCIDSALCQEHKALEIILVDDGSTDGSGWICDRYAEKNPGFIKVIHQANAGLSAARNTGVRKAEGEYVYFIDGDDYVREDALASFVSVIGEYGHVDFIHGRMSFFSDGGEILRPSRYYIDNQWAPGGADGQTVFCNAFKNQGILLMGVRGLYKTSFFIEEGLWFKEGISPEDDEWTPRLFFAAKTAAGCRVPAYCYRENRKGSLMNTPDAVKGKTTIDNLRGWECLAKEKECSEDFRNTLLIEAGRRFYWSIKQFALCLTKDALLDFLDYADKNKDLLQYCPPLDERYGKSILLLLRAVGIKRTGRMLGWYYHSRHKPMLILMILMSLKM